MAPEITADQFELIRRMPEFVVDLRAILDDTRATMERMPGMILPVVSGAIDNAVTTLRDEHIRTRAEIMARIDRLQGTAELVREDGRVNWATADTALDRVRSYRQEIENLSFTISAMERRYQTLMAIVQELREQNDRRPEAGGG